MGVINLGILIKKIMGKISGAGYIKDTDYASSSKGGTIKVDSTYATDITSGGKLKAKEITAAAYSEANDAAFISKATLDNVLKSKGYSETEHIVGKWIDGTTDVYEKTIVQTNFAYSTASTEAEVGTIPGVDKLISIDATFTNSAKTTYNGSFYMNTAGKYSEFYLKKGETNQIIFISSDTWSSTDMIVTVRYTKAP